MGDATPGDARLRSSQAFMWGELATQRSSSCRPLTSSTAMPASAASKLLSSSAARPSGSVSARLARAGSPDATCSTTASSSSPSEPWDS